ncbi:MAG: hypothetical protein IKA74_02280 [Clostridia bacterium]|nr:hypothetical protein [Clostridia bacterium]
MHDGITDIDGVLCKGTYEKLGEITYDILKQHGNDCSRDEIIKALITGYNNNSDVGEVKPTCPDLAHILSQLKAQKRKQSNGLLFCFVFWGSNCTVFGILRKNIDICL